MTKLFMLIAIAQVLAVLWLLFEIRRINRHLDRRGNTPPPAPREPEPDFIDIARREVERHESQYHTRR